MEDNKTKQGESTPEEYLEKNTFQAFTGEGAISYIYPRSAKIALEMARKSEREKVIMEMPSVDDAGVIAVKILQKVKPEQTAQEQAIFIAGFQECIKYLSMNKLLTPDELILNNLKKEKP
jgi:hypothetical protein